MSGCRGKKLKQNALAVKVDGLDIIEFSRLPLQQVHEASGVKKSVNGDTSERGQVIRNITGDIIEE